MAIWGRRQNTLGCQGLDLVIGETIRRACPPVDIAPFVRHAWNPRHPPHGSLAAQDVLAELFKQFPTHACGFKQERSAATLRMYMFIPNCKV